MIVFLGVFAAIALLAVIVYALHKFQQKEKEESVDRNSPLPPLPSHSILDDAQSDEHDGSADKGWQTAVKELKNNGELRQAIAVCVSAYPQMGAFKQACVLLRAELRGAKRQGKSVEAILAELYRVCAMAAFFHDRDSGGQAISMSTLKSVRYDDFSNLSMPYKDLGYSHLKLLTPTDIRMLEEMWGVPDAQRRVREFHADAWKQVMMASSNK